jgi:hypothetical protein
MLGCGGIIGSVAGGFITQYSSSRFVFYVTASLGVIITVQAFVMDS